MSYCRVASSSSSGEGGRVGPNFRIINCDTIPWIDPVIPVNLTRSCNWLKKHSGTFFHIVESFRLLELLPITA